jgi:SAM-dependent methyltransferase
MNDWAIQILRCVRCNATPLDWKEGGFACRKCGVNYSIRNGISDFLTSLHAVPQREREAVEKLSEIPEAVKRLQDLLQKWDTSDLSESDYQEFECLRHAAESRKQLIDLLERYPIPEGSVVLEIGADHCWTSNLFLDRNCKVFAIDITNHLELASRASDPNLFRAYADMNLLPLKNESVDIVWTTSAAHHTWDLERTFQECFRVLKPQGSLCFSCEPIPSILRYFFGKDFGHQEREAGINEMWIRRSKWLTSSRKAGFQPQLIYPSLDPASISERLRQRRIPAFFAPLLTPFMKYLQVSIHLFAQKSR